MSRDRDEASRTRRHEAGHAVLGRVVGLKDPTAVASFGDEGVTRGVPPSPADAASMTRDAWRAYLEADAISSLAGKAALEAYGDIDPGRGAGADLRRARRTASLLDPAAPDAVVARLYRRAVELAREHRAAIVAFDATLAANGNCLSGARVGPALAAARAGRPRPRRGAAADFRVRRREHFEAMLARSPRTTLAEAWRLAELAATDRSAARQLAPKE